MVEPGGLPSMGPGVLLSPLVTISPSGARNGAGSGLHCMEVQAAHWPGWSSIDQNPDGDSAANEHYKAVHAGVPLLAALPGKGVPRV